MHNLTEDALTYIINTSPKESAQKMEERLFLHNILYQNLIIDMSFSGNPFTWSNGRTSVTLW